MENEKRGYLISSSSFLPSSSLCLFGGMHGSPLAPTPTQLWPLDTLEFVCAKGGWRRGGWSPHRAFLCGGVKVPLELFGHAFVGVFVGTSVLGGGG